MTITSPIDHATFFAIECEGPSASLCPCISRTPPGVRYMFTPTRVFAIGSLRTPSPRAQPLSFRRSRVSEGEHFKLGTSPE